MEICGQKVLHEHHPGSEDYNQSVRSLFHYSTQGYEIVQTIKGIWIMIITSQFK